MLCVTVYVMLVKQVIGIAGGLKAVNTCMNNSNIYDILCNPKKNLWTSQSFLFMIFIFDAAQYKVDYVLIIPTYDFCKILCS